MHKIVGTVDIDQPARLNKIYTRDRILIFSLARCHKERILLHPLENAVEWKLYLCWFSLLELLRQPWMFMDNVGMDTSRATVLMMLMMWCEWDVIQITFEIIVWGAVLLHCIPGVKNSCVLLVLLSKVSHIRATFRTPPPPPPWNHHLKIADWSF